jgi:hypothetical protein
MTAESKEATLFGESYGVLFRANLGIKNISFPVVYLTRPGLQLASILPNDEITALRALVSSVSASLEYAALHERINREGSNVSYRRQPIEILFENKRATS